MKIVFLDVKTIGDDIDLSQYNEIGEVVKYDYTSAEEVPARIADADVVILNKVEANAQTLAGAKNLKLICVTATGTNNLDKEYLDSQNIAWRNVAGYSTESVAQHTFAMYFFLAEKLRYYDDYVKSGTYMGDTSFTHFEQHFNETAGQTWGIIGLGAIGRRVADIAACFGAKVIYYSPSGSAPQDGYQQVDFDTLLRTSDIISVHAPLTACTQKLMNQDAFEKMKSSAIFLNLGRGPIVDEAALTRALENHSIAGAGLDVLDIEPMAADNPLAQISDSTKLLITPHIGWASIQARTNLMNIIYGQIKEYLHL